MTFKEGIVRFRAISEMWYSVEVVQIVVMRKKAGGNVAAEERDVLVVGEAVGGFALPCR